MDDYWDKIIGEAAEKSIKEFADKASSHVKLTQTEIEEIIPQGLDKTKFAELIKVIKDSTKSNKEKAENIRNISGFAEMAANIIAKII